MPVLTHTPLNIFDPRRYLVPEQRVTFQGNAPSPDAQAAAPTREIAPGYESPPEPPLVGTDMPAVLRTPDAPRVADVNAGGAVGPSWDNLRQILGSDIGGRRVSAPQIFNGSTEQHPLAQNDDLAPRRSQAWDIYNASRSVGSPDEVQARRNEVIARHNANRDLENQYYNMNRGMFTPQNRESIGRWGIDPTQGGGTEGRLAGAQETTAGAHQTQALTGAATLEAAMSTPQLRQRFMERFPHMNPAQLDQLVAGEEARGGFAPRGLLFPMGGRQVLSPANQAGAATGQAPAANSSLLSPQTGPAVPVTPPIWDALGRQIESIRGLERPAAPATGGAAPREAMTPGELVARAHEASPSLFSGTAGQGNRDALIAYLNNRFDPARVREAASGVTQGALGHIYPNRTSWFGPAGNSLMSAFSRLLGGNNWDRDMTGRALISGLPQARELNR